MSLRLLIGFGYPCEFQTAKLQPIEAGPQLRFHQQVECCVGNSPLQPPISKKKG